jgi:hypothetical protein
VNPPGDNINRALARHDKPRQEFSALSLIFTLVVTQKEFMRDYRLRAYGVWVNGLDLEVVLLER